MPEKTHTPEQIKYSPIMFLPQIDEQRRPIKADGAQVRVGKARQWTDLLILATDRKKELSIIRPDESTETLPGNMWFVYGDSETGMISIAAATGKFELPASTLMIGRHISASILSFRPEKMPDLKVSTERSLQPMALIYQDQSGKWTIARRYSEQTDMSTNTVSFVPANFELNCPEIEVKKAAERLIMEFQSAQKEDEKRRRTINDISVLAKAVSLRLAHKRSKLPSELRPSCVYNEETGKYEITLFVSGSGRNKIIRPLTRPEERLGQIGNDFDFGARLMFETSKEISGNQDEEIAGSFSISNYNESADSREVRVLAKDVRIVKSAKKLRENLINDPANSPVFAISFSSNSPDDIINILVGIDRSQRPRYLPEGIIE